jgi:hypothetical protein
VKEGAWQIDRANAGSVRIEAAGERQLLEITELK